MTQTPRRDARRLPMWLRLASLALILALAGNVAVGLPLHSSERGCNMPAEPVSCEGMGHEQSAPSATAVALCCFLDCQEPGPPGTAFNLRIPTFSVTFVYAALTTAPTRVLPPLPRERWLQSSSFNPPEPYLKNLALLI